MMGIGGIGSVAQVQNQTASSELLNFNVPLSISVTTKAQDWATRQRIQYAALEGLIAKDFLSLADWSDQIGRYSQANVIQLSGPFGAIASSTRQNLLFKASNLVPDPTLGLEVGLYLETLPLFADVFVGEPALVENAGELSGSLGVS